jgi:hypothetical protein
MITSILQEPPSSRLAAPSQNTAPVFEFRCLYTHDLRKKRKIWHDGSLHFHTFNRRVMVYDDTKHYIGDAHWRETSDFQEGEELRLDKGVLVEVGEKIGHTETDLTPIILGKRRPEIISSPPQLQAQPPSIAYAPVARPAFNVSGARPKSLNAVLGASQGPIGRARMPGSSPFELRQQNVRGEQTPCERPPAKRSRIATVESRVGSVSKSASRSSLPQRSTPKLGHGRAAVPNPRKEIGTTSAGFVDSSVEIHPRSASATLSRAGIGEKGDTSRQNVSLRPGAMRPGNPLNVRENENPEGRSFYKRAFLAATPEDEESLKQSHLPRNKGPLCEVPPHSGPVVRSSSGSIPTNKLRFTKEQPRNKLMYRDLLLLARNSQRTNPIASRADEEQQGDSERRRSSKRQKPPRAGLARSRPTTELLCHEENLPVRSPSTIGNDNEQLPCATTSSSPNSRRSTSPLFCDLSLQMEESRLSRQTIDDGSMASSPLGLANHEIFRGDRADPWNILGDEDAVEAVTELEKTIEANIDVTVAIPSTQGHAETTVPNQQPPVESAIIEAERADGRARSQEKQSRIGHHAVSSKNLPSQVRERDRHMGDHEGSADANAESNASVGDSSDTTRRPGRTLMSEQDSAVPTAVEAAFEPWSEPEAYLLFDWWPPDRKKPNLGVVGAAPAQRAKDLST